MERRTGNGTGTIIREDLVKKGKIYEAQHSRKGSIRFKFINQIKAKDDEQDPVQWLVDLDTKDVPKAPDWSQRILRPSLMTGDFD
jgi:hypothetical protein